MSENIDDKIVNHLVAKHILLPALESSLIDTNVATRYDKGSGYAFKMFTKYINKLFCEKKEIYILKIDISKYFYNIDHNICIELLNKNIKDEEALEIIEKILNTTNESYINIEINNIVKEEVKRINNLNISKKEKNKKISEINNLPYYLYNKGLPIGNMTSQILAVYYLNEVDHYIKEELKFKYYIRYMDDLIILDNDKQRLHDAYKSINKKIENLKLKINQKSNIYKLNNGITFLGYTFKSNKNKLIIKYNKKTCKKIIKRLNILKKYRFEKYLKSKGSYKGFLEKCNTKLYDKMQEL